MKKLFIFILLCFTLILSVNAQSAGPLNPELEAAVGEMLEGMTKLTVPLFDASFAEPEVLAEGTPLSGEELNRVIGQFEAFILDQGEAVHEYIVDSCRFVRSEFDAGTLKVTVVEPVSYAARNLVYIKNKFDPDKEPEIFISRDLVERFRESPESGISFFVNLFKQYYDVKHNSIDSRINGRNLLEELLYWRDARIMQVKYLEFLMDDPDIELQPFERFLSDSYYRDTLGGYFYLVHRLDADFILNFARGLEMIFAPRDKGGISAQDYLSALVSVGSGMRSYLPDDNNRDQVSQYATRLTTMVVFYPEFLLSLARRYPIYRESEEFQKTYLAAFQVWKEAVELAGAYPDIRRQAVASFLTGFYEKPPVP